MDKDDEKCEYSKDDRCLYYEDNDLKCNGCIEEQNKCAVYIGYFQQ